MHSWVDMDFGLMPIFDTLLILSIFIIWQYTIHWKNFGIGLSFDVMAYNELYIGAQKTSGRFTIGLKAKLFCMGFRI
ncbi:MAG: hypothetical protein IPN46_18130 [Saprospiraceae bacterium]|nr:hypothetical protein [Saprospiraceae bacterium]